MKLGYYPGCSAHHGAKEYDLSLKAVTASLGIELDEVKDWSCCGATAAHSTDHLLAISLAARNLSLSEAQGHQQVMAPCAACYSRLAAAQHELAHDPELARTVAPQLQRPFTNKVEVLNVLALLSGLTKEIKALATPLAGLKVACYYGCLLLRPPEVVKFDDPENPSSMESIVEACGATPVKWARRVDCCGGGFSVSRTASVVRLGRAILEDAKKNGAQAIIVACPMCQLNLDLRQAAMEARGESLGLPILYVTQLVGLALKVVPEQLGLKRHFVSAAGILQTLASPAQKQLPA